MYFFILIIFKLMIWSSQKVWDTVHFGQYGIPMGTNCASPAIDLSMFCYKTDFLTILMLMLLRRTSLLPDI